MHGHIIEQKMGMYLRVREFSFNHQSELEQKHVTSLSSRFQSHNQDLLVMEKMRDICLADNTDDSTLQKINIRAEAVDHAHEVIHLFANTEIPESFARGLISDLMDVNVLEDMEFYNYMYSLTKYLKQYNTSGAVPEQMIFDLELMNEMFLDLLERTALDKMEKKTAGDALLRTSFRMDDRLRVMDVLIKNFMFSDRSMYLDYMESRDLHRHQAIQMLSMQKAGQKLRMQH